MAKDYKEIVWVDDQYFDAVTKIFGEELCNKVSVKNNMYEMISYLEENYGLYDKVVLDINLEQTCAGDDQKIRQLLEKYHIVLPSIQYDNKHLVKSNVSEETYDKNSEDIDPFTVPMRKFNTDKSESWYNMAGYYIYLYLIHKGFPVSNICMRTAYVEKYAIPGREKFEEVGLCTPEIIGKDSEPGQEDVQALIKWYNSLPNKMYSQIRSIYVRIADLILEELNQHDTTIIRLFDKKERNEEVFDDIYGCFHYIKAIPYVIKLDDGLEAEGKCNDTMYLIFKRGLDFLTIWMEASDLKVSDTIKGFNKNQHKLTRIALRNVAKIYRNWSAHNIIKHIPYDYYIILYILFVRNIFDVSKFNNFNIYYKLENEALAYYLTNNVSERMDISQIISSDAKNIFDIAQGIVSTNIVDMLNQIGKDRDLKKNIQAKHLASIYVNSIYRIKFSVGRPFQDKRQGHENDYTISTYVNFDDYIDSSKFDENEYRIWLALVNLLRVNKNI